MVLIVCILALFVFQTSANDDTCVWDGEYSEICAKQAMRYSSAAYEKELESLWDWSCTSCKHAPKLNILTVFQSADPDGAVGYVGVQDDEPNRIILAFRGTVWTDVESAKADLKFTQHRWPRRIQGSTVDHGFLEYFFSVENQVRDTFRDFLKSNPDPEVIITGHSLGGALAVIASVVLSDLIDPPTLYTFGTPRIGNDVFASYFQSSAERSFRVIHDHDLVPHLPPCNWEHWSQKCSEDTARHAPTEILYNADMTEYRTCSDKDGEDDKCSHSFKMRTLSIEQHRVYFGTNMSHPDTDV